MFCCIFIAWQLDMLQMIIFPILATEYRAVLGDKEVTIHRVSPPPCTFYLHSILLALQESANPQR